MCIFFFSWHYNSLWVLACSTILFQACLPTAILLQCWIFIFPISALTSSSHLNLGLPILLTAIGFHSVFLFTILSLFILTMCITIVIIWLQKKTSIAENHLRFQGYIPVSCGCLYHHGWIPPCGWPKKAETCRRITTCLYIIVYNYSAVVGTYMVTGLPARNMNNFKNT